MYSYHNEKSEEVPNINRIMCILGVDVVDLAATAIFSFLMMFIVNTYIGLLIGGVLVSISRKTTSMKQAGMPIEYNKVFNRFVNKTYVLKGFFPDVENVFYEEDVYRK